jgi:hypothetical protein
MYFDDCAYELKLPIAALANPNDVSNGLVPGESFWKLNVPNALLPWFSALKLWFR